MTRIEIHPCLYCDTPGRSQEHVLQQMFGTFESNELTTYDVCRDCNSKYFGEKLELAFGRNSMEAIFRLIFGAKSPEKAHEIGGNRVSSIYLEDDEFRGARLSWSSDGAGSFHAEMPPQVIIKHSSLDVPRALLEREITSGAIEPYLKGSTVIIPGDREGEEARRLIERMKDAGFVFVGEIEHVPVPRRTEREFLLRIDAVVDDAIARVATKMAVNLLAVAVGYDFAMRPEFRPMRKYARYGEPQMRHRVLSAPMSIAVDAARERYGNGHILTLDWSPEIGGVIAQICLYNRITHQVHLADTVDTGWRDIRTAFYCDIVSRRVERLKLAPRVEPTPGGAHHTKPERGPSRPGAA